MEKQKGFKISQYACAVLLIVSSIVMVKRNSEIVNMYFRISEMFFRNNEKKTCFFGKI